MLLLWCPSWMGLNPKANQLYKDYFMRVSSELKWNFLDVTFCCLLADVILFLLVWPALQASCDKRCFLSGSFASESLFFMMKWTIYISPLNEKYILILQTQWGRLGITFIASGLPNLCRYSLWMVSITLSRNDSHFHHVAFGISESLWALGQRQSENYKKKTLLVLFPLDLKSFRVKHNYRADL